MAGQQYEVEVKVLLGEQSQADAFLDRLRQADDSLQQLTQSSQLNHYFTDDGDPHKLFEQVRDVLAEDDQAALKQMLDAYQTFSLRTRDQDGTIRLVVKAAKPGEDDQHAVLRAEGDYVADVSDIDQLDQRILKAGYGYLSKWSRDRREFRYKDYTVSLDRNAGYGYLAEVEKVVDSEGQAEAAKAEILAEVERLGFAELPQDRLGRMFDHYNQHWPEYYRTDKTFTVE